MQKFKFFTLAIIAMLSVNLAWGEDIKWSWTATSGALGTTSPKTVTLNEKSWTVTRSSVIYTGFSSSCIQFGSSSGAETVTLSSSDFSGTIKSVAIECSSYNNAHTVSITVGSTTYLASTATAKWTTVSSKSGTGTSSGEIVITLTKGSRAVYIKSISVTYEESSCTQNPTVNAGSNSSVTSTTATVSCSGINSLGSTGCSITSYGFVIGTSDNPSIGGSGVTKYEVGTSYTTTGTAFSKNLTGLSAATTYYVRPYATNNNGTGYGTQTSFLTPALPKYTVTFNAGSGTCGTASLTEASAGAGVTLPAALPSSACGTDGWTFAGWATASQAETTAAPTLYAASSNYKPSSNCTLYAVYSKTESSGGGTPSLTKMVKGNTIAAGDKLVIVANNTTYAMYQTSASSYVSYVTFSSTVSDYSDAKRYFEVSIGSTGGYCLGDATNGYLYSSSSTNLDVSTTNKTELNFIDNNDGTFKFQGKSATTRYLDCRTDLTSGNANKWRFGSSGTQNLDLYKYSAGGGSTTTYNSNPSCATCTNLITITKGTPSHGSFTLTDAGTDICADEPVTVNLSNITADTHYHATAVTTSATTGGGTPSAITSGGSATVSGITASTIINVTFAEDTKVVVTLLNNNNPVNAGGFDAQGKKEYYIGETLGALPTLTSSDACDATSVTFMGWTTEQITTKRAAAPVFVDTDTPVNAAMTLRAVWARGE